MALIETKDVEDSQTLQKKLQHELTTAMNDLGKQKETLKELKEQISAVKQLEKTIEEVKVEFYSILTEQIKIAEISHANSLIERIEREVEALTAAPAAPATTRR